jgi:hypothetical protein
LEAWARRGDLAGFAALKASGAKASVEVINIQKKLRGDYQIFHKVPHTVSICELLGAVKHAEGERYEMASTDGDASKCTKRVDYGEGGKEMMEVMNAHSSFYGGCEIQMPLGEDNGSETQRVGQDIYLDGGLLL